MTATFKPDNENAFQGNTRPHEGGGRGSAVSIRCPHCRQLGSFEAIQTNGVKYSKAGTAPPQTGARYAEYFASIRLCPNVLCMGIVLVIEAGSEIVEIEPPQLIDFDTQDLPTKCVATLKEAVSCHAAGAYRAAAMMVRRLLEEICEANGATGDNLHQRLIALKSKIVLPQALFEAMNELKALGNDAAHIEAKAYDNIGPEEAADSIELAKEIFKALYQLQGLVGRLQARKNAPGVATAP